MNPQMDPASLWIWANFLQPPLPPLFYYDPDKFGEYIPLNLCRVLQSRVLPRHEHHLQHYDIVPEIHHLISTTHL